MLLRNTNPDFGDDTPFEANSKAEATREMRSLLLQWARERYDTQDFPASVPRDEYVEREARRMAGIFMDGLQVVEG